jgi:hypothetical protein
MVSGKAQAYATISEGTIQMKIRWSKVMAAVMLHYKWAAVRDENYHILTAVLNVYFTPHTHYSHITGWCPSMSL